MIKLIAFLGNYGTKYENTRHNAAWFFSDMAEISSSVVWQNKFKGKYSKANTELADGRVVHLLKPETFMNLSGESVEALTSFFRIKPENILIIHDELELKPGILSFKWSGGLGGHNGLRSIKANIGTADFFRFRIGIGRPDFSAQGGDANPDIAGYVLSKFSQTELQILNSQLPAFNNFIKKLLKANDPQSLIKEWAKVVPPQIN